MPPRLHAAQCRASSFMLLHVKNLQWNSKTSNGNYYLKTQLIKMKFKP